VAIIPTRGNCHGAIKLKRGADDHTTTTTDTAWVAPRSGWTRGAALLGRHAVDRTQVQCATPSARRLRVGAGSGGEEAEGLHEVGRDRRSFPFGHERHRLGGHCEPCGSTVLLMHGPAQTARSRPYS
jgi:hypothetical protein